MKRMQQTLLPQRSAVSPSDKKWWRRMEQCYGHPAWYLMLFALCIQQMSLYFLSAMQVDGLSRRRRASVVEPSGTALRSSSQASTITGCLGPFHVGEGLNLDAITAWMYYHEKRWGLTHVEIHIQEKDFQHIKRNISSK